MGGEEEGLFGQCQRLVALTPRWLSLGGDSETKASLLAVVVIFVVLTGRHGGREAMRAVCVCEGASTSGRGGCRAAVLSTAAACSVALPLHIPSSPIHPQ